MEELSKRLEEIRKPVMKQWLKRALPGFAEKKNKSEYEHTENIRFEDPLYFYASQEFQKIYDFILINYNVSTTGRINVNDGAGLEVAPVAETWIKYKSLNSRDEAEVVGYVDLLKEIILGNESESGALSATDIDIINQRAGALLESARTFYKKTKKDISILKNAELENGVFSEESLGTKTGYCPSALMENSCGK